MIKIFFLLATTIIIYSSGHQNVALQYHLTASNFSQKKIFPVFNFRIAQDKFVTKEQVECQKGVCTIKLLNGIFPYDTKILRVQTKHQIQNKATLNREKDLSQYLKATSLIETNHPLMINAAQRYQKLSPKKIIHRVSQSVKSKVKLSPFIERDLGALFALKEGKGDCTEIAALITALLRINKIPSKIIGGFYLKEKPLRYHN